jgi:hypothetical protein
LSPPSNRYHHGSEAWATPGIDVPDKLMVLADDVAD